MPGGATNSCSDAPGLSSSTTMPHSLALADDPALLTLTGCVLSVGELAARYGTDVTS